MARAEFDAGNALRVQMIKDGVSAEIALISAGLENTESVLDELYERIFRQAEATGDHVDDLAEDFDYEIAILPSAASAEIFARHMFFRLTGNVICIVSLDNPLEAHEDQVRELLSDIQVSNKLNETPALARLALEIDLLEWDRAGQIWLMNGDE